MRSSKSGKALPTGREYSGVETVGKNFAEFKKQELSKRAFSLRCPKIPESGVSGESKFDAEILLIGQQIQNGNCKVLREQLAKFADLAGDALGEKVEFCAVGENDN